MKTIRKKSKFLQSLAIYKALKELRQKRNNNQSLKKLTLLAKKYSNNIGYLEEIQIILSNQVIDRLLTKINIPEIAETYSISENYCYQIIEGRKAAMGYEISKEAIENEKAVIINRIDLEIAKFMKNIFDGGDL